MKILHPEAFGLFIFLIPVVLIGVSGYHHGKKDLRKIGGAWQMESLGNVFLVKWFFSTLFFVLGLGFGIVALAGLSWGQKPVEEDRVGIDVAFLVDVSRSMLAEDVLPSRLVRTGDVMRGVVRELQGSRFSMTIFKGDAVQILPVTEDVAAVENVMDALSTSMISSPGTDLEAGLASALASFPEKMERHRVVLLFSDGESLSGLPLRVARQAGDEGIPVYVIGAGGETGVTIPLSDGKVVLDEDGKPVLTALKRGILEEVATLSSGRYFQLGDPQVLSQILKNLREFEGASSRAGFRLVMIHQYRLFLLLSLGCFFLYTGIRVVKWKKVF